MPLRPMKLSADTTQAELEQLYRAASRREMLRSTPLNINMFLRYALLFILFPGMVGGFRVGLGLTLLFCALLGGLLLGDMQDTALLAVRVWLSAGALILLWVSWKTTRAAQALYRLRNERRPAEGGKAPAPQETPSLLWRRSDDRAAWEAEWLCRAEKPGLYALLLRVQGAGKSRILTSGRRGVCVVQSVAQGDELQTLLLYRLEKGCHRLHFYLTPAREKEPLGEALWLSTP